MAPSQSKRQRKSPALSLTLEPTQDLPPEDLVGLYFFLRDKMSQLEPMLCDFYTDLIRQLDLLDSLTLTLDGKEQILTEELMQSVIHSGDPTSPAALQRRKADGEYTLFKGAYIRLFEEGSVFQKIMYRIFERLGEAKIVWVRWKSNYKLQRKSNPKLRAFYRFVDNSFLAQLPTNSYVAFAVDALLYCRWRCSHPNLVGYHMLILAWMLNVSQFRQFAPPQIRWSAPLVDPLLQHFWPMSGLALSGFTPAPVTKAKPLPATKAVPLPVSKPKALPVTKAKAQVSKATASKASVARSPAAKQKKAAGSKKK